MPWLEVLPGTLKSENPERRITDARSPNSILMRFTLNMDFSVAVQQVIKSRREVRPTQVSHLSHHHSAESNRTMRNPFTLNRRLASHSTPTSEYHPTWASPPRYPPVKMHTPRERRIAIWARAWEKSASTIGYTHPWVGKHAPQLDYQWELPRRYNRRPDIHGSFSAHPPGKLYLEASTPRPHCRLCNVRRQETMPSTPPRVVTAGSRLVHGLAISTVDAEHLCLPPLSPQATSQSLDRALAMTLRPTERRG